MTEEKCLWWMVKISVMLPVILNSILCAYSAEVLKEDYSIGKNSRLLLWAEKAPCKEGRLRFLLGKEMETIEFVKCSEMCSCGQNHKCVKINDFRPDQHVCVRECNRDNDCEYHHKCQMKEKYCFWKICRSNADCKSPLICDTTGILREKRCGRRSCDNHAECKDNQVCDYSAETCVCANGLSGRKCEVEEWCQDGKFKDCKGVNGTCKYIKERRRVDCICDNGRKLHFDQNRCVETCTNDADCKNGGTCKYNGGYMLCSCKSGVFGEKCETVFDCTPNGKYRDCERNGGKCFYDGNKATCGCSGNQKFNDIKLICEDCICRGGKCFFKDGKKVCECPPGYGNFNDSICKETCDIGTDCKNGGVCEEKGGYKFCSCKLGVSGDKCETVFDCTPNGKYKNCENSGGKCSYEGSRAICECPQNQKLNDKELICETCICRGGECLIEDGKKVCKCPPGYGNFTNISCKACDCGPDTDCIWEGRFGGGKICFCKPGYSTKKGKCAACDCGPDSNCEWISERWLEPEKKVCHCKSGYLEENGKCVDKYDLRKSQKIL